MESFAPPIAAPISPAVVDPEAKDSIAKYLHFPKEEDPSKLEGAVQFYCEITETGVVEAVHALVGNSPALKGAVQTALDWGRFTPATMDGKPVRVYLGGTVLFLHQGGQELVVVSLATQERERVGKLANYVQPQIVGGLRHALEQQLSSLTRGILVAGRAEAIVNVDEHGKASRISGVTESPKGSGLGALLESAMRKAQFTPAYENGKAAAGGINVVADFGKF